MRSKLREKAEERLTVRDSDCRMDDGGKILTEIHDPYVVFWEDEAKHPRGRGESQGPDSEPDRDQVPCKATN